HLQLRVINATTPPLPSTLSLHDALPILHPGHARPTASGAEGNDPGQPAVDHERPPGVAGAGVLAAFRVARAEHAGRHEAEIGLLASAVRNHRQRDRTQGRRAGTAFAGGSPAVDPTEGTGPVDLGVRGL